MSLARDESSGLQSAGAAADAREAGPERRRSRPRALPTIATIVAIAACIAAGQWQQGRMHAKEALRAQLDAAGRADPVALARLAGSADWTALRYRPVVATGEYLSSRQILIDNKVHSGRAGYHVVTPLALADGRVVLVNRGWIAQGASRSDLPAAPAPSGVVAVQGRVAIPAAGYLEFSAAAPAGPVWQNLDPQRIAAADGLDLLPIVVEATAAPLPDDALVRDWPAPDFGIEQHRIYMVQWYLFALVAAVLWIWFHRRAAPRAADG